MSASDDGFDAFQKAQSASEPERSSRLVSALAAAVAPQLRRGRLAILPSVAPGLDPGFADRGRAAIAASGAPLIVIVGPQLEVRTGDNILQTYIDLLLRVGPKDGTGILAYFEVSSGGGVLPHIVASGARGTSDRLDATPDSNDLLEDQLGGVFPFDPSPYIAFAAAAGQAWLQNRPAPNPKDFAGSHSNASMSRYLELAKPGGTSALAATTTAVTVGAATVWVLERRRRAATVATVLPTEVVERVRSTAGKAYELPPLKPNPKPKQLERRSERSEMLGALEDVRARVGLEGPRLGGAATDIAALWIMDQLAAEPVTQPITGSGRTTWCYFNPFHGKRTREIAWHSGRGQLSVPACENCRTAVKDGHEPRALLVRAGTRVRPYYQLDDGYARTGLGAFAPIHTDIPNRPASGPPPDPRRHRRRAGGRIALGVGAVLVATVVGAGIGAIVADRVVDTSNSSFDPERYADTEDYPTERIDALAGQLKKSHLAVEPGAEGLFTKAERARAAKAAASAHTPIWLVFAPSAGTDESGGEEELLANRIAAQTGKGIVVLASPTHTAFGANGYDLTRPDNVTSGLKLGWKDGYNPDGGAGAERLVRAIDESHPQPDPDVKPKTARTQGLRTAPDERSAIVPNALRGAGAGAAVGLVLGVIAEAFLAWTAARLRARRSQR
ncbi:hypothetical protein BRM1_02115 [Brevibacterium sp. BRM-1]|uniref:hypothetical protein n=1 Tax=Brevibacterium sp. BRM-1 TaxID=2999062 RepID=UPI002281FD6E|nr:hypothetical protein [Brevibacterium sp. BRM-1]WAL40693.1 hypothetical protein BRM1_02115 [Brevibacterium sp. BRM-1]